MNSLFTLHATSGKAHVMIFVLPFKPQYPHAYSSHCSLYTSHVTSWENLIKHQVISCLMIIFSFILMACIFDLLVISLGEIRCLSLLGVKGKLIKIKMFILEATSKYKQ